GAPLHRPGLHPRNRGGADDPRRGDARPLELDRDRAGRAAARRG
ncbi:MAG: hypothetical protein AVDCRST_MAG17-589, partial [uncultured Solirubrobacterales bacterium]